MTTVVQQSIPRASATPMTVYDCIVAVSSEIAQDGISKTRSNQQQGYKFRGIDDVLNALSPLLAKYRLVILPRITSRSVVERETKNGGVLFYVTVEAEFDFVSAADGSTHTVKTYGEAMDSADKATNKAMSAAYKYAALQTFCIPTEGEDADATTHEVKAAAAPTPERPAFVPRKVEVSEPLSIDMQTGEELPPGFMLIDAVEPDGAFTKVYWNRDAQGGWRKFSTKVPHIATAARVAFEERVPVRLHSKDGKYLDKVERLDGAK